MKTTTSLIEQWNVDANGTHFKAAKTEGGFNLQVVRQITNAEAEVISKEFEKKKREEIQQHHEEEFAVGLL